MAIQDAETILTTTGETGETTIDKIMVVAEDVAAITAEAMAEVVTMDVADTKDSIASSITYH